MASGQNPYDPKRGQGYPPAVHSNAQASSSSSHEKVHESDTPLKKTHRPPGGSRASSWDLLGGIKKVGQSYEQFDTRNASQSHLVYADGDMPKNKVRVWLKDFFPLQILPLASNDLERLWQLGVVIHEAAISLLF